MADDIAPDWLRGKLHADPRFQQALRTLPLSAFEKVERIFDPNRGVIRVFGFYDNFTATVERDPEPMVLHPMFEDWHAAQPPETAAAAIPAPGAGADWQTPALAIAGERGIDPQQMRGMNQLEAARYLQSNDPANLAPDIGKWLENQSPEHLAALEREDPVPAGLSPLPGSLLRSLHARGLAPDGQTRAKPASVQATRSQLWDTARLFNVDPTPMETMTDADAWSYLDSAQEMPGRFNDTYRDFNRRAFIGQPEPSADPNARAPSSEGGQAVGEAVLGFAPGIGTVIGAKDLVASYRAAQAARARGDEKALAEAERMMGLSLIGLLPFMAGITRAGRGAKVIVGAAKGKGGGRAAKGREAMATEGTARVLPKLPKVSRTENPVTLQEFARMPDAGVVDPRHIRTLQDSIKKIFQKGPRLDKKLQKGGPVDEMIEDLHTGRLKPADVDPIRIVEYDGKIWTLDHRRLVAFRAARFKIRYQKVEVESEEVLKEIIDKKSTKNDGLSIRIRKGR